MTTFHSRTIRRQAFTLVELMIVIAIIGLLVAMLSAAIYKAIIKGKETRNRIEIGQLEVALQQFQQRFGVFPPSRLKLCENFNYYGGTQLDVDSVAFIQKMFTNIDMDVWKGLKPPYGMNWNGNKDPATGADLIAPNGVEPNFVILEGDQVLVFCLGGIPAWSAASSPPNPDNSPPNCLGFSTNPRIPALPTDDRIGPFFEFTSSRLVVIPQQTAFTAQLARSPQHYSYLDTFGVSDGKGGYISGAPYAYFSSYKGPNGYNRYYDPNTASATYFPFSDCPRLNVWPYAESRAPVKYLKSSSFQIISAGLNGFFGGGTALADSSGNPTPTPPLWTPANAAFFYPAGSDGYDDQANFTSSLLGVGAD